MENNTFKEVMVTLKSLTKWMRDNNVSLDDMRQILKFFDKTSELNFGAVDPLRALELTLDMASSFDDSAIKELFGIPTHHSKSGEESAS